MILLIPYSCPEKLKQCVHFRDEEMKMQRCVSTFPTSHGFQVAQRFEPRAGYWTTKPFWLILAHYIPFEDVFCRPRMTPAHIQHLLVLCLHSLLLLRPKDCFQASNSYRKLRHWKEATGPTFPGASCHRKALYYNKISFNASNFYMDVLMCWGCSSIRKVLA